MVIIVHQLILKYVTAFKIKFYTFLSHRHFILQERRKMWKQNWYATARKFHSNITLVLAVSELRTGHMFRTQLRNEIKVTLGNDKRQGGECAERPGRSIGAFQLLPPRASTTAVVTFPCHSQTCNSNCFHCSCHECVNTETLLRRSETLQPERKLYRICVAPKSATMDTKFMEQAKNLKVYLISTHKYIWYIANI